MKFEFSIIDDFITQYQSNKLIEYFTPKLNRSQILSNNPSDEYSKLRTSKDYHIDETLVEDSEIKEIINLIKTKISEHSKIPKENQELLNIIRYLPGEQFQMHYDAFSNMSNYYQKSMKSGGQRLKTYIICLKKANSGGHTSFPRLNKNILLENCQCIFWDNVDANGNIFEQSLHSGRCPIEGEKWILTCWIRENKFLSDK